MESSTQVTLQTEMQASCDYKVMRPMLHLIQQTSTD